MQFLQRFSNLLGVKKFQRELSLAILNHAWPFPTTSATFTVMGIKGLDQGSCKGKRFTVRLLWKLNFSKFYLEKNLFRLKCIWLTFIHPSEGWFTLHSPFFYSSFSNIHPSKGWINFLEGDSPFKKGDSPLRMNAFTLVEGWILFWETHSPFEKGDSSFKKGEWKGE